MGLGAIELVIIVIVIVFIVSRLRGSRGAGGAVSNAAHPRLAKCPGCGVPIAADSDTCPQCGLRLSV